MSVVSIDDRPTVETDADKARDALLDLVESFKTRRILTGTIQGVERPADNPSRSLAVLYHGDFKIIIPAEEAVEPPDDFRGRDPGDVLHYMLTKRLGAEVDYIVKGIDGNAGIAAAAGWKRWRPNAGSTILAPTGMAITCCIPESVRRTGRISHPGRYLCGPVWGRNVYLCGS